MRVIGQLIIKIHDTGAMSVEGPIEETEWCLAVLENAADVIRNRRTQKRLSLVPPSEVSVPPLKNPLTL